MNAPAAGSSPRLGRPPSSNSAATRRRILDTARFAFAVRGYENTTNRSLGAEVGITSGAIYHYYGSKLDLYIAVHADVQDLVYDRFRAAVDGTTTFRDRLDAVLDEAHQMNEEDPTLAQFLGSVRVDIRRHPELAHALSQQARIRENFFESIADLGIETGEIAAEHRQAVSAFLKTILIGLTDAVSNNQAVHSRAIEGIKGIAHGDILRPAPKTPPPPARSSRRKG